MAAHRYWRVRTNGSFYSDGTVACATLALKTSVGGSDIAGTGTAFADSVFGGGSLPAANATDGNSSTIWASTATLTDHWIGVDFGGSPADIAELAFTVRADSFRQDPKKLSLDFSDDNISWTEKFHSNDLPVWTAGQTQTINATSATVSPEFRATQSFALTAINFPATDDRASQVFGLIAATPTLDIQNTQSYILVAIKVGAETRMLRAWTFTQDDHDFYVLQAGGETYVYDKLSQQWCQWTSPDAAGYWRGADGCDWNGINVCIDPDTGKLFKIDPDNRLDYGTTPIVSQVFGGMTERFRNMTPCYMAEVAISQARPPAGIDASTVGIQLRTYDTISWTDHGTLQGQPTGSKFYTRFYGLGLLQSPGVLFEITDYGYARRIDGLNVEMGGTPDGQ